MGQTGRRSYLGSSQLTQNSIQKLHIHHLETYIDIQNVIVWVDTGQTFILSTHAVNSCVEDQNGLVRSRF